VSFSYHWRLSRLMKAQPLIMVKSEPTWKGRATSLGQWICS